MLAVRTLLLSVALGGASHAADSPELQAAKAPVETWLGLKLEVYEDTPLPGGMTRIWPREAETPGDAVKVAIGQLRTFQSSQELAEFLAHAAAHARLGHPDRFRTLAKAVGILGPGNAGKRLDANTRAEMEKEAEPVIAEFMETSGCAPGPCAMFGQLLRAVRLP